MSVVRTRFRVDVRFLAPWIFLVLLTSPLRAQSPEDFRVRGDSLRAAGDILGAVTAYNGLFSATVGVESAHTQAAYSLAATYALQPQPALVDSAFKYLTLALTDEDSMEPLYDPDLYFLVDDPRWTDLENTQLDKLARQVTGKFDREYARKLLGVRMHEWAFRYHLMLMFRESGGESPVLTALAKAMDEHHAADEQRMLGWIADMGWPRLSAVGEEAAYAAGNVVNHAGLDVRQRMLPILKAACEAGEAGWSRYAHILDRTELELGHPQVYGTQMEMDEATGDYVPQKLLDPEHVDERRAAKGIEPIAVQLKRFNDSMKRDFGG